MGLSCAPNRDGYDGDDDEVGFGDRLRLHVDEFKGDTAGLSNVHRSSRIPVLGCIRFDR